MEKQRQVDDRSALTLFDRYLYSYINYKKTFKTNYFNPD
jgi:hypothetical protein